METASYPHPPISNLHQHILLSIFANSREETTRALLHLSLYREIRMFSNVHATKEMAAHT